MNRIKKLSERVSSIRNSILLRKNIDEVVDDLNIVRNEVQSMLDQFDFDTLDDETRDWIAVADDIRLVGEDISTVAKSMAASITHSADADVIEAIVTMMGAGSGMGAVAVELAFVVGVLFEKSTTSEDDKLLRSVGESVSLLRSVEEAINRIGDSITGDDIE